MLRKWYEAHKEAVEHFFFCFSYFLFFPCLIYLGASYKHGSDFWVEYSFFTDVIFAFYMIIGHFIDSVLFDLWQLRRRVALLEHEVDVLNGDMPF